jgi:mono/diheme cytochrome c family protein
MRTALAIVLLPLVACNNNDNNGASDMSVPPSDMSAMGDMVTPPSAARGEYLVKSLLLCGDCHTTPDNFGRPSTDPTKFLAGGREFDIPGAGPDGGVAMVFVKNLTGDNATGLGMWTQDQVKTAFTTGIDDQGKPLFPIMPYWQYANLTDSDATSVAMFIKSVPGQSNAVPMDTISVPGPAPAVDDTQVPHTTLAASDSNHDSAERGRYLCEVVCLECHTKHNNTPGPVLDLTHAFAGGEEFPLIPGILTTISANITPDDTGLKGWMTSDIIATLKTDQEKGAGRMLCPPMPGGPNELGSLHDSDLTDIANYVHTLPPIHNGPFGCDDAGVPYGLPDGG